MSIVQSLIRGVDELLFPPECLVCQSGKGVSHSREAICDTCRESILADTHESCPRCCATVGPHTETTEGCPKCRKDTFAFDAPFRLSAYDGQLKNAILRIKHRAGEALADALGRLWAEYQRERFFRTAPDLLIPIPLHWIRLWQRGYNQAESLARGVGEVIGVPVQTRCLIRDRNTPMQSMQSPAERRENVKNAFFVRWAKRLTGKRILLIDDVMTTGATAHEAAKALRSAGAAQVSVAVLAHR